MSHFLKHIVAATKITLKYLVVATVTFPCCRHSDDLEFILFSGIKTYQKHYSFFYVHEFRQKTHVCIASKS